MNGDDRISIPLSENREPVTAKDRDLAQLAKALGHPIRVAILRYLMRCGSCICGEIVDQLPVSQATVSQHLKVLREAGFLRGEIDGPRVCYCLNPEPIKRIQQLIGDL